MTPKPPVECISSEFVYQGYFNVRKDRLLKPDGDSRDYTFLHISWNAAVVLAEDREGRLIVNREYRHPTSCTLFCLPGGGLEEGEDPLSGGLRELFEETGYWSDELSLLGASYPCASVANQIIYFVHAKNAYPNAPSDREPFEFIETLPMTEQDLRKELLAGAVADGILCTALWYKSQRLC